VSDVKVYFFYFLRGVSAPQAPIAIGGIKKRSHLINACDAKSPCLPQKKLTEQVALVIENVH